MTRPVVCVTHRFAHHAARSGYDRLAEISGRPVLSPSVARSMAGVFPQRFVANIRQRTGQAYLDGERLADELAVSVRMAAGPPTTYHFLYGENGFHLLGRWAPRRRRHRLVATFHRPASILPHVVGDPRTIAGLDHAVLLGESQRAFFRQWLPDDRISVVPYGVDTGHFCPNGPRSALPHVLFVGHYERDFETLIEAVKLLADRLPGLRTTIVTRPRWVERLRGLPSAEVRADVPDVELVELYRRATVLLLPLRDAVANSTLLEAMASGLPIVTTDVGSSRNYVAPSCGALVPPSDAGAAAEAVETLARDPARREAAGQEARSRAEHDFDWKAIAPQIEEVWARVDRSPPREKMPYRRS